MADSTPSKEEKASSRPESPTTAHALDFDDDQQETGIISNDSTSTPIKPPRSSSMQQSQQQTGKAEGGDAPPKPPRPMSPQQQAENTLIEAFPDTDPKVVKAILVASNGQVEPAFNALLGMSDPNFKPQEEPAPPKPPRPTTRQQQEAEDERLARQMFAHEQAAMQRAAERQRRQEQPYTQDQDEDASTFEVETPEDFAAFRENLRQGFNTTQQKFNSWMTDFRKRIDGDDEPGYGREDEIGPGPASQRAQRQNFGPSQREQLHGIQRQAAQGRRSTDQDRYDADPRVLSDNFSELELRDEEAEETPPQKPSRPLANPNLFKPTPATPSPIAPQSGPVDEVDALYRQPTTSTTSNSPHIPTLQQRSPSPATSATKSKKWQPLTSVAPAPEAEEHDPFSVGDSEEDEESKREKATDLKKEDTERLKRSSGQVGGSGGEKQEGGKSFGPSERSGSVGSRDKTAEEILKGEKSG